SLDLFADVIMNASFNEADIERVRPQILAGIEQEKSDAVNLGFRNLPPLVYGKDHAYGISATGSGNKDSVETITRDHMVTFKNTWIRPDNATIMVVGDSTLDEMVAELERVFASWKTPATELPVKNLASVDMPEGTRVIIMDKPEAQQTVILAGHLLPNAADDRNLTISTANGVLGGSFTARINMNLREDKGWSYGARSIMMENKGQGMFLLYAPVQTDKTKLSLEELERELAEYLSSNPATPDEMAKVLANRVNRLPGAFETGSSVLSNLLANQRFGRGDDYVVNLAGRYQQITLDDIHTVAGDVISPKQLVWLLVGDQAVIADEVRAWSKVPVEIWDKEGNPIAE
ncbi:MAG: insulinase family protein, partial [Sphingomonadales bacterium]|nr:insulinase family protein [Sphingomonadales bacterium]